MGAGQGSLKFRSSKFAVIQQGTIKLEISLWVGVRMKARHHNRVRHSHRPAGKTPNEKGGPGPAQKSPCGSGFSSRQQGMWSGTGRAVRG